MLTPGEEGARSHERDLAENQRPPQGGNGFLEGGRGSNFFLLFYHLSKRGSRKRSLLRFLRALS